MFTLCRIMGSRPYNRVINTMIMLLSLTFSIDIKKYYYNNDYDVCHTGVQCQTLDPPAHGTLSSSTSVHRYPAILSITCDVGYTLQQGSSGILGCGHDGMWSGPVSECQGKKPLGHCIQLLCVGVYLCECVCVCVCVCACVFVRMYYPKMLHAVCAPGVTLLHIVEDRWTRTQESTS